MFPTFFLLTSYYFLAQEVPAPDPARLSAWLIDVPGRFQQRACRYEQRFGRDLGVDDSRDGDRDVVAAAYCRAGGLLMRRVLFAVLLGVVASSARAADCWTITNTRTGDVGIGSTRGGVSSLGRTITHRQARLVYLINPATGKGATFRIFTGGTVSTKTTWRQFVATETGR